MNLFIDEKRKMERSTIAIISFLLGIVSFIQSFREPIQNIKTIYIWVGVILIIIGLIIAASTKKTKFK